MDKANNLIWQAKMQMKTNWLNATNILEDGKRDFPSEREIYTTLGDIYLDKELHKKAIENFQKALELDPSDDHVRFKYGNCLLVLDEYRMALDQYNQCGTSFPELVYNKAFAYYKMGKLSLSIQLMEEIIKDPLTTEMPLIFMTELQFMKQQYDDAIFYIEMAEKRFGMQGNLQYLKGLAYFHQHFWLKSFIAFQKADKLAFATPNFLLNYGMVANKIGKYKLAEKILLNFIEESPNDGQGYAELINIYLEHDMIVKAEKLSKRAKKNAAYSLSLSMAYSKLSSYKKRS